MMQIYNRCAALPLGKGLFSRLVCLKAPYFGSITPRFERLEPGFCRIRMKKRRAVTNHLGSVHAIAMCNLAELAAGTMVEASIPPQMRWIPKGMSVSYDKMARTDLTAQCTADLSCFNTPGECPVEVEVTDRHQDVVFRARISMYLSLKK